MRFRLCLFLLFCSFLLTARAQVQFFPPLQQAPLVIEGSPEGRVRMDVGILIVDRLTGKYYSKTTTRAVTTGWVEVGVGTGGTGDVLNFSSQFTVTGDTNITIASGAAITNATLVTPSLGVATATSLTIGATNVVGALAAKAGLVSPAFTTPNLGVATSTTLDTGQGANELFDMDQNVLTTSSPTFVTATSALLQKGPIFDVKAYGALGDNSANDTAAIQATIVAAQNFGGGTVVVPPGTYKVKALTVTDSCTIRGSKGASIFTLNDVADATSANYFIWVKTNNVTIEGISFIGEDSLTFGTIGKPYYGIQIASPLSVAILTNIVVKGCEVKGGRIGMNIKELENSRITGNSVYNTYEYGIVGPSLGRNVSLDNNHIERSGIYPGIRFGDSGVTNQSYRVFIRNNTLIDCGILDTNSVPWQEGIDIFTRNARYIFVEENTISGCGGGGIEFKTTADIALGEEYRDVVISRNKITVSAKDAHGIRLNYQTSDVPTNKVSRISVKGNYIFFDRVVASTSAGGVFTSGISGVEIADNTVDGAYAGVYISGINNVESVLYQPIVTGNTLKNCSVGVWIGNTNIFDATISHNVIQNCGQWGIRTVDDSARLVRATISHNTISQLDDAAANKYGLYLHGLEDCRILYNQIISQGYGIHIVGSSNVSARIAFNTIICNFATGVSGIRMDTSGTFQIHNNSFITSPDQRGWLIGIAGPTVLSGINTRGVSAAIPTIAGALNDFFYDSTAGASRGWICTVAGASGAATWVPIVSDQALLTASSPTFAALTSAGNVTTTAGNLVSNNGGVVLNASGSVAYSGRSRLLSSADGNLEARNAAITANSTLQFNLRQTPKTTNYTLVALDSGQYYNNTGASAAKTNTLPTAAAGMHFWHYVDAAQIVSIKASGSDVIRWGSTVSAAAGDIWSSQVGSVVHLVSPKALVWEVDQAQGAWTLVAPRSGNLTLIGGTLTVANTTVTANSIVLLSRKTAGGTLGAGGYTYTTSAGTSFTVTSVDTAGVLSSADTSTISWNLLEVPN